MKAGFFAFSTNRFRNSGKIDLSKGEQMTKGNFVYNWLTVSSFFMLGSIGAILSIHEYKILIFILGPYLVALVILFAIKVFNRNGV